jgi:hypothetical protein
MTSVIFWGETIGVLKNNSNFTRKFKYLLMKYSVPAIFIYMLCVFLLSACDRDTDIIEPKYIIESIVLDYSDEGGSEKIVYNYDSNYQLIAIKHGNGVELRISYESSLIGGIMSSSAGGVIALTNELNSSGGIMRGTNVRSETINGEKFEFAKTCLFTYNDDKSLASKVISSNNNGAVGGCSSEELIWSGGNLVEKTTVESSANVVSFNTNVVSYVYTEHENRGVLDLNHVTTISYNDDAFDFCALVRKTGESSRNLVSCL